jgi:hypothetical protein
MATKWKSSDLSTKLEMVCLCEVGSSSKKRNRTAMWINFSDIVYDIEEQTEDTVYTAPELTSIVPFFHEYILVKICIHSFNEAKKRD